MDQWFKEKQDVLAVIYETAKHLCEWHIYLEYMTVETANVAHCKFSYPIKND
jgi:hypothetical protein